MWNEMLIRDEINGSHHSIQIGIWWLKSYGHLNMTLFGTEEQHKMETYQNTLNTKVVPSKETALAMLDSFKKKRLRAKLAEKWVSGKRNYVVQVGEYETEVDAARDIELVRGICSCKPTVVKRD